MMPYRETRSWSRHRNSTSYSIVGFLPHPHDIGRDLEGIPAGTGSPYLGFQVGTSEQAGEVIETFGISLFRPAFGGYGAPIRLEQLKRLIFVVFPKAVPTFRPEARKVRG